MSETISEASHTAFGATECSVTVQLDLRERGVLTMSNCTSRQSGCRSSARATRHLISSSVASVLLSKSISHPIVGRYWREMIFGAGMVNGALNRKARKITDLRVRPGRRCDYFGGKNSGHIARHFRPSCAKSGGEVS